MRIGVVLAGGASSQSSAVQLVPRVLADDVALVGAVIVAADSGLDLARRLRIVPTLVVGDLDSVSSDALQWAHGLGIEVRSYPPDKDETDLDLALTAVVEAGVDRVIVLGGAGGRLDHLLGNIGAIAALGTDRLGGDLPVEAWLGSEYFAVVTSLWSASLPAGAIVSVLPIGGPVVVSEAGVRWPLDHHTLPLGSTQGISNEAAPAGGPVEITVHEGRALVVVPNAKDLT